MMEEIWKDIKGFEGRYQVSNMGRVKSLARLVHHRASIRTKSFDSMVSERIMKQHISNSGYLFITLRGKEHLIGTFVHRLVAESFIPNPNGLKEVNHKDEDKLNNHVDNLEWCTPSYNMRYGTMAAIRQRGNIRNRKSVIQLTMDGVFIRQYESLKEMHSLTGINKESVSRMCRGLNNRNGSALLSAGGYKWKFAY